MSDCWSITDFSHDYAVGISSGMLEKYRLVLMLFKQLSIIIKVQSELLFKSSILTSESILD